MIVYVHGALSTRYSFSYIAQALEQIQTRQCYFSYDIRLESSNDIVDTLIGEVLEKADSSEPITFIAHSFGGIVAVDAARVLAKNRRCNVISLATPFGGSAEASVLKLLRPSSKFLANIGSYHSYMRSFMAKPLPCRVRGLVTTAGSAVWMQGENDGVVTIKSQLHYESDINWSGILLNVNHFEVLLMPKAVEFIRKELVSIYNTETA